MTEYRRLRLLVEGQTEETIVRNLVGPHLEEHGYGVYTSVLGGVSRWAVLKKHVNLFRQDSSLDVLTTLIDYYGFPTDSPGMADIAGGTALDRVLHVEAAMAEEIGDQRFLPNLVLHETEAWVFAAADQLADLVGDDTLASDLRGQIVEAGGPENVNDGPHTAPSKRLLARLPDYTKTTDGPLAVQDLGLEGLRRQCPHFDTWLKSLDA